MLLQIKNRQQKIDLRESLLSYDRFHYQISQRSVPTPLFTNGGGVREVQNRNMSFLPDFFVLSPNAIHLHYFISVIFSVVTGIFRISAGEKYLEPRSLLAVREQHRNALLL